LLSRPANIGMHRNLEGVLAECRGEFVAFLEGDDYWICEDKLQLQIDLLRARDDAIGVFHRVMTVDHLGREIGFLPTDTRFRLSNDPSLMITGNTIETVRMGETFCGVREIGTQELLQFNVIPALSVVIRRDVIPNLPPSFRELRMRDWPMWIFASLRGPWLYLPKMMAAYRFHDGGVWNSMSWTEQLASTSDLLREAALNLPPPFSSIARQQVARVQLAAWEHALASDRPDDARLQLREVVQLLSFYQTRHLKRLVSALWQTLSPRSHRVAKRALQLVRQDPAKNKIA